jgi:hypothetical protein
VAGQFVSALRRESQSRPVFASASSASALASPTNRFKSLLVIGPRNQQSVVRDCTKTIAGV